MAQLMTDEQRLKALEAYDPREHLIAVGKNKDNSPVLYYPAAWRLYELRLRHPHFTLEAEIAHMNEETGAIIIKAIGYDGLDYATSTLKGMAFKPTAKAASVTKEQINSLYDAGKAKGHWQGQSGMCAFCSAELSLNLAKEDFLKLSPEQYQQLVEAVEQEASIAVGAGAGR